MRICRSCGQVFFLCQSCDRGHAYCGEGCREVGYARTRREARRRHQQTPEGRLDHRDRMRACRARQAGRVTDQGSRVRVISGNLPSEHDEPRREVADGIGSKEMAGPCCAVCGRRSEFAQFHPGPRPGKLAWATRQGP